MAGGQLLQLKPPFGLRWSLGCESRRKRSNFIRIANAQFGCGRKLQHGFGKLSGSLSRRGGFGLGLGDRPVVAVAAGEGETRESESEVVPERIRDEIEPSEENSSFPVEFKDLTVHRRVPPNLLLYAAGSAGFCGIVLMRDLILREFAGWGINFGQIALFIAEGLAIALGKLTNLLAEPIAFLLALLSWTIMAITDIYTLIVDLAPTKSLLHSLLLALAVLSIGDATACPVRGSRSRLVGLATAVGVAGVLEFIPPEAVLLCLALLTAFAKVVQNADVVTVITPATVTLVAISEPALRIVALIVFVAVAVYANWRCRVAGETGDCENVKNVLEQEAKVGMRPSVVFSAISASIVVSLAARLLYMRSVKWLLLRST